MDGLSVAKIRTSLVQCLRGYSVNGFGLQRKKDAGGPYTHILISWFQSPGSPDFKCPDPIEGFLNNLEASYYVSDLCNLQHDH